LAVLTAFLAASTASAAADFGVDEAKDVGHQFSEVCQAQQQYRYADERVRDADQSTPERLRCDVTVTWQTATATSHYCSSNLEKIKARIAYNHIALFKTVRGLSSSRPTHHLALQSPIEKHLIVGMHMAPSSSVYSCSSAVLKLSSDDASFIESFGLLLAYYYYSKSANSMSLWKSKFKFCSLIYI